MKNKLNNQGFTLVEVLMAVTVFSIAIAISSSVFLSVGNLQRETVALKNLQNEGRYLMEKMVREIRAREIDYESLDYIDEPVKTMTQGLIFHPDEQEEVYQIIFSEDSKSISVSVNEQSAQLNSDRVEVVELKFYVYPFGDNIQPGATILLKLKNKEGGAEKDFVLNLQTSVSSRVYR
jgi:prepilin-type N-terminal cleavage/methylation domain-containing protein